MKLSFFKETYNQDIYEEMVSVQNGNSVKDVLLKQQRDRGISTDAARKNADAIMLAVSSVESVRQDVSDDPTAVLDKLFEDIDQLEDPYLRYCQLYFCLTAHTDEDAIAKFNDGVSEETLFWQFYDRNKDTMTVDELKSGIRKAVAGYDLPEPVLKSMAEKFRDSKHYFATAAAMGDFGYNIKCIAAMNMYLDSNGTLSVQEAANRACTDVEFQAVADSVNKGFLTSETAKMLLIIAGITLAIVGIATAIYFIGSQVTLAEAVTTVVKFKEPDVFSVFADTSYTVSNEMLYKPMIEAAKKKEVIGWTTMFGGIGLTKFSPKLAELIGKFRVGIDENGNNVAKGLDSIADHATKKIANAAVSPEHEVRHQAVDQALQNAAAKAL